ncbi:MAG: hypothetical protein EA378_10010 [Phycisphaerales bacterium]|nr:MAG: hypothetical protein EA378_10010 [Phycisphaerales bacterium]
MRASPVELERPVVILNGYRGPGYAVQPFLRRMARLTSNERRDWHAVNYTEVSSIERAAEIAANAVDARWPSDDPDETIEVDVIGISMGGLVAREAAIPSEGRGRGGKRLRIARLYTIGTPHRGATVAERFAVVNPGLQMSPGSAYLASLDEAFEAADYELIAYTQLNDTWVGDQNTAPPGVDAIWSPGTPIFSHFRMTGNRLIVADLARRLRGETPLAEPSPIPDLDRPRPGLRGRNRAAGSSKEEEVGPKLPERPEAGDGEG